MNDIKEMIKNLNIDPSKIEEIEALAQQSPFAAFSKVQELGISMDVLQKAAKAMMSDPASFLEMAKDMGVPDDALDMVRSRLKK